jgi:hypothetical protein
MPPQLVEFEREEGSEARLATVGSGARVRVAVLLVQDQLQLKDEADHLQWLAELRVVVPLEHAPALQMAQQDSPTVKVALESLLQQLDFETPD